MKRTFRYLLFTIVGVLALVGVSFCGYMSYGLSQLRNDSPYHYVGSGGWEESLASQWLTLPEQEANFPMVVESVGMCDYSAAIIFRAPADWQETFCRYHTRKPQTDLNAADSAANMLKNAADARIQGFYRSRHWSPLHDTLLWQQEGKRAMDACLLRDTSGEHLLLYLHNF